MYRRILVPLDGSPLSEQALACALGICQRTSATLHFVRVRTASAPDPATCQVLDQAEDGKSRKTELGHLEQLAALPRACGLDIRTAILNGPVVDALQSYVHEANIDLVVMTTHGRGGISRMWLGSVADTLVRNLDVPVLLLRPACRDNYGPGFGVGHIVIPVDGTPFSEHVIEHAITVGRLTDARFTLVQVVAPPMSVNSGPAMTRTQNDALLKLRAKTMSALADIADQIRARGFDVSTAVIVQSQSAAGILEYAMECRADLIAMATHGHSGRTRPAIGSVADKVLRGTQIPLLVIRPDVVSNPAEVVGMAG